MTNTLLELTSFKEKVLTLYNRKDTDEIDRDTGVMDILEEYFPEEYNR